MFRSRSRKLNFDPNQSAQSVPSASVGLAALTAVAAMFELGQALTKVAFVRRGVAAAQTG